MEYSIIEKQALDMMKRTDFKNLSKVDILSIASKLSELRPDVAKEIIQQFPEFVGLMKSALNEYKEMLDSIVSSDDASLQEYYNIANKEIDSAAENRKQIYDIAKQVQADCSKLLDNPNLSPEMLMEILCKEAEIVKLASQKDAEILQHEKEVEDKVNKKGSEKRQFNWKLIGGISFALMAVVGISASVLGGKFDIKFPKKQ